MAPISKATVEALRGPVMSILRKSDLTSISAKKVRNALINTPADAMQGDVGSDVAGPRLLPRLGVDISDKKHKDAVDELVRECFDVLQDSSNGPTGNGGAGAIKSNGGGGGGGPKLALPGMGGTPGSYSHSGPSASQASKPSSSSSSLAAPIKKRNRPGDDEVISEEEDADAESISKAAKKSKAKVTKRKKKASSTAEDGEEKVKKAPNPNNPFNKPVVLSEEMSQVCGGKEMPRYMITKQLWVYIKARDLQDPSNKRKILCDPTLTKLFGKSEVDSFEMAKLISPHVSKKVES